MWITATRHWPLILRVEDSLPFFVFAHFSYPFKDFSEELLAWEDFL